ncbi:MAG: hypothetical protein ACP5HQ_01755 [Thermoprotei archaeon]
MIYPILRKHLGFLKGYKEEDVYSYFNVVRPSLIRVDADELTYNFHIAVRFYLKREMANEEFNTSPYFSVVTRTFNKLYKS